MSAAHNVDIERLLEPIPGENPVGESLRYEGTYDAIREARREDDPTLPQGVWKTELKKANWKEVETLCTTALSEKSKDLQIAVWLTEAWIHRSRVAGAAAGFELLNGMSERYWDGVFPPADEGDLDARLAPIEWANDRLSLVLKTVQLSESVHTEEAVTWSEWEAALYRETHRAAPAGHDGEEADEVHGTSSARAELLEKVEASSTEFYRELHGDVVAARDALSALDSTLHGLCGDREAPSLGRLRDTIEEIGHFIGRILTERDAMEEEVRAPAAGDFSSEDSPERDPEGRAEHQDFEARRIGSRAEAYRALADAADYLTAIEPHSPAPYLVRRAIKWGRMSLAELLRELLRDNADLPTVYSLLGIRDKEAFEE
jgi:type VI secretion system protein ImpA